MNILVSACLLGLPCRYDGQAKASDRVLALRERHTLIPVCPEQLGGLATPRAPSELCGGRVCTAKGQDNTAAFAAGALCACRMAALLRCEAAVLKSRSPSCGIGRVYDGTFSGTLTDGDGVTASALKRAGLRVMSEEDAALDTI